MFCFCKNKTCFKTFNKIRRKGIKFQRYYLIRHMCKSNEISILKLSTKKKSKLETFEVDRFETKSLAAKIFLSKTKWNYLNKLRKESSSNKLENKDSDPVFEKDDDDEWEDIQTETVQSELPNTEEISQLEDDLINQVPANIQETPLDIKTEIQNLICEEDISQVESNDGSTNSDVEITENVQEAIVIDSDTDEDAPLPNGIQFEVEFDTNRPIEILCMENVSRRKRKLSKCKYSELQEEYECQNCGKCFVYEDDYKLHINRYHQENRVLRSETPPNTNSSSSDEIRKEYPCLYCRHIFKRKKNYVAHTLLHFNAKSNQIIQESSTQDHSYKYDYRCYFCNKLFEIKARALHHIKIAHYRRFDKDKCADDYIRVREIIERDDTVYQICHLPD